MSKLASMRKAARRDGQRVQGAPPPGPAGAVGGTMGGMLAGEAAAEEGPNWVTTREEWVRLHGRWPSVSAPFRHQGWTWQPAKCLHERPCVLVIPEGEVVPWEVTP